MVTKITTTDGAYTVDSYIGDGTTTWTVPSGVTSVEYMVIAGGGSGGNGGTSAAGGGGGAGGVRYGTLAVTPGASLTVVVGTGATIGTNHGNKGANSVFSSITSIGGGYGGAGTDLGGLNLHYGGPGGSGGGAGGKSGGIGGAGTSGQGYAGGSKSGTGDTGGSGGGGATSVGSPNSLNDGGAGGSGYTDDIVQTGINVTYASGAAGETKVYNLPTSNMITINANGTTTPAGVATFSFDGSDETSALNAVFDYAASHLSTYANIVMPSGKTIYVSRVDVHAGTYCYGNGCTIKLHHDHGPDKILGCRGTVDGLKVDGSRWAGGSGILTENDGWQSYGIGMYAGSTLKNCEIYEIYGYVVDCYGCNTATITGNYIHDCTQYGIASGGGSGGMSYNITITNNIIKDIGDVGIKIRGTNNSTISGNTVIMSPIAYNPNYDPISTGYALRGISFYTADLSNNNNVTVTNNTVVGNIGLAGKTHSSSGIQCDSTGSSTNCTVTNNNVSNCDTGLDLGELDSPKTVTGNTMTDCDTCMSTYYSGNTCN